MRYAVSKQRKPGEANSTLLFFVEAQPFMLISCRTQPSSHLASSSEMWDSEKGLQRSQCVSKVQVVACSFCKWRFCLGVWAPTCQNGSQLRHFSHGVTQPHLKIESPSGRYFIHVEGCSPQFYHHRLPSSPDSGKPVPVISSCQSDLSFSLPPGTSPHR